MIAASILAFYVVTGFGTLSLILVVIGIAVSALVSWFTRDALTKLAAKFPANIFLAGIGILALVPFTLKVTLDATG